MVQSLKSVPTESPELDETEFGPLNEILGFHIRLAHGAVYRHFMETFAHLDLTQKQVSVLWLINDRPGVAQTDLAQRLRMDRATMMGVVNRLEKRGFLRRGRSLQDRRRKALYLEPGGKQALLEARAAIGAHEKWLKSRFSAREVTTLMNLLERIHE